MDEQRPASGWPERSGMNAAVPSNITSFIGSPLESRISPPISSPRRAVSSDSGRRKCRRRRRTGSARPCGSPLPARSAGRAPPRPCHVGRHRQVQYLRAGRAHQVGVTGGHLFRRVEHLELIRPEPLARVAYRPRGTPRSAARARPGRPGAGPAGHAWRAWAGSRSTAKARWLTRTASSSSESVASAVVTDPRPAQGRRRSPREWTGVGYEKLKDVAGLFPEPGHPQSTRGSVTLPSLSARPIGRPDAPHVALLLKHCATARTRARERCELRSRHQL